MLAKQNVIIIGGGIAGPALALFLQRAGIHAEVYEAYPERRAIGGALGLAPNGMNVLDELGLADAVVARGTVMERSAFRAVDGTPIGATPDVGTRFGRPGVTLSRAAVHETLLDGARRAGVPVHFGKRLVAIEERRGGVVAVFEDGTAAEGDWLVGADGIHSRVRELVLPNAPKPEFTGLVGPGGFMPRRVVPMRPDDDGKSLVLYMNKDAFFGYGLGDHDAETGGFWWTAIGRDQPMTDAERAAMTFDDVRRFILDASPAWDPAVRQILDATTEFVPPLNIFDVPSLPRWWSGRAVLIGDAAHAVSPHSGQGASLALEDAIVLAKLVRDGSGRIEDTFAAFEAARRDRVERIVAFGRRSGNSKKKMGPIAGFLMRMLMPLLIRMVGRMQAGAYGYRVHFEDGEERKRAA